MSNHHNNRGFCLNMLSCGEMSVLERQRAVLERLYSQSKQQHSLQNLAHLITGQMMGSLDLPIEPMSEDFTNFDMFGREHDKGITGFGFTNNWREMVRPSFSTVSNSSITTVSPPPEKEIDTIVAPIGNVVSTKKRKAEQFSEEEDCKTKSPQSGISEKSQRAASGNNSKENSKTSEIQKPEFIHVRARRGQATDSHSLAERARREKISKKMKYLQDLVPGCNKVTGKAGMLDEIINYVQSLQKQVEFLSMKLAALNPRLDLNTDNFFTKDFPSYMSNFPTVDVSEYNLIQHQQMLPQRRENYLVSASSPITVVQQQPNFETDLQSLFQCQL